MKSDFCPSLWQCLSCSAELTCEAGLRARLPVLACPRMGRAAQGMALAGRNGGSVVWTGLSGSQSGFPGALRAWAILGDGGGWSQCPGTPQLQPHPIPSGLLARQDTVGCGRRDPKAAKHTCSDLAGSVLSYLYERPKHLRSFRENRAVFLIHLPLW